MRQCPRIYTSQRIGVPIPFTSDKCANDVSNYGSTVTAVGLTCH